MKEKVFVVEGWEGDIHIFHKEENAMDYFFRPFTVAIDADGFEFRKQASLSAKKVESGF